MSRRCKSGVRARFIRGDNRGKVVVVVRRYFGEVVNDAHWPRVLLPWVVTSLGPTLTSHYIESGLQAPPAMTIVADDCDLEPLVDDEDEVGDAANAHRPVSTPSRIEEPSR